MTQHYSIFGLAQADVCTVLNEDEVLSGKVLFIPENSKDIDYEIKNAIGSQGIVGIVMTPEATYQGVTSAGEQVWDLRDFTVLIVENPIVNRGQPKYANITALDAATRVAQVLADPRFGLFGLYCPTTIEQGEDSGLIVSQVRFNVLIKAKSNDAYTYIYFADGTTKKVLWEGEVTRQMAEAAGLSDISPTVRIVFGTDVTSLADECFAGLPVTEVSFKSGLLSIGRRAFAYNGILTNIELPETVLSIAEDAFLLDQNTEVTFQGKTKAEVRAMENYHWGLPNGRIIHCTDGDIVIGNDTVVTYKDGSVQTLLLSGELVRHLIPNWSNAVSILIGSTITSIANEALFQGDNLETIVVPDTVTSIGNNAFAYCQKLTSVTLGQNVTSLGDWFIQYADLTSLSIPKSVTTIAYYALSTGDSKFKDITFEERTIAEVQAMTNYQWRLWRPQVIHCTDGDITF